MEKIYSLYNGKIKLVFDEGKHTYKVNDEVVYGVTSITSVISKPGLVYWAANVGAQRFTEFVKPGLVLDEVIIKQIADVIRSAHVESKNKSADIGTMIHEWLEQFLKAGLEKKPLPKMPVNPEMRNAIEAFLAWTKQNKVKFLESERKVYSIKYKYAGTCDAVATVNGKPTIIDFKTGNSVYPEMFLQTVAYQKALEEETGKKFTHNLILRLYKEIPDEGIPPFEVIETTNHEENFEIFLAAKRIYEWQMANKKQEILNGII
jgi:hypothetical protein